jgi:hypothetical protein
MISLRDALCFEILRCCGVMPVGSGARSFHMIDKLNKPYDESDNGAGDGRQ